MKAGLTIKLKDGRTVKSIPNLTQILNQKDSCVGCCFSSTKSCGAVDLMPGELASISCGSFHTEPVDEQVIFMGVTEDEGGR